MDAVDVAAVLDGLAKEQDYSGDMKDSATMNMWLHKEAMRQLAANGAKVPENLLV